MRPLSSTYEIFSWILGSESNSIFPIKIANTEYVATLKNAIKEKKGNTLQHVDADTLDLWSMSIPVDERFKEKLGELHLIDDEKLNPAKELWEVFKEPPIRSHLHIVVRAPPSDASAKRASEVVFPDEDMIKRKNLDPDPNLVQLHNLFWGQTHSRHFKTVNYPIPNIRTLEKECDWKDSSNCICLPDKMKFPFEESNLLVTDVYETFWGLLLLDDEEWQKNVGRFSCLTHATIITGQPGIGKTVFLSYILVRRLQEKMITIYCDNESYAHIFSADGVKKVNLEPGARITALDENSKCSALVNISGKMKEPPDQFYPSERRGRVIIATSPHSKHLGSFSNEYMASIYFMPTLDWCDVYRGSLLFANTTPNPLHNEKIKDGYLKFGGIPRRCFSPLMGKDAMAAHLKEIDDAINRITSWDEFIKSATRTIPFSDQFSDKLVRIEPIEGTKWRLSELKFLTNYVAEQMLDRLDCHKIIHDSGLINKLLSRPSSRGLSGYLFAQAIHEKFRSGVQIFPEGITDDATCLNINIRKMDGKAECYFDTLTARAGRGKRTIDAKYLDRYLRPASTTNKAFDAVWLSKDVTVFFKITVSPIHPLKMRELVELRNQLPSDSRRDICILFVVPANDESTKDYPSQDIVYSIRESRESQSNAEVASKYPQYVYYFDLKQQ